ncbi:DUF2333 family protein [Chelativorans intermedius]|nr:DUF2333 family protein [Chelativorans intermedius]MCT8999990.1 DUF2333 family protein [Chelativorans intermedius]
MLRLLARLLRRAFSWLGWPFQALRRWYARRGWILRTTVAGVVLLFLGLYGYFFWQTQIWHGFDPDYVRAYGLEGRGVSAGEQVAATGDAGARTCGRSAITDVAADLTDFNVNENAWITSMLLYKLGFFGLDWDDTPFFDNKASFQRGVNQTVRRTAVELVDALGRVRGTSQIDSDLQKARENIQFSEDAWYFGLNPFGPKTPTPSFYRTAITSLRSFNDRLERCEAVFDARADNLIQFLDRVANDLGSTSAILRERSENYNAGWFDTRADDRFWFAYGQLYGYYGMLHAARADFEDVVAQRSLESLWETTEDQFRAALDITPAIVSNGREAGWIMPTHLATMGFYILRVRSNLVELRQVLDR